MRFQGQQLLCQSIPEAFRTDTFGIPKYVFGLQLRLIMFKKSIFNKRNGATLMYACQKSVE